MSASSEVSNDATVYEAFTKYDFDSDQQFQSGMSSILKQADANPETREQTLERAKWFYYNKFIQAFDFEGYQKWKSQGDDDTSPKEEIQQQQTDENNEKDTKEENDDEDKPPKFTFQELVEMIESGKEVPGIRQIPNKLNDGTPSEPKMPVRRKPWEKAVEDQQQE
ncbi:hypothetical protein O0I10_004338 [Lichtheimia ornata]|uniref:Uncharacterized protein n=1 Tax=Lichtheimia ornata TaxID=688661 RepID=A0AAD7V7J5_9FUNG|nr:uncharacterized protein O0I10_004338 [Lichtheimia ornata]KAJ8659745.1 hypothetical protein O0I10_004338 [Lichtheimia ornata]